MVFVRHPAFPSRSRCSKNSVFKDLPSCDKTSQNSEVNYDIFRCIKITPCETVIQWYWLEGIVGDNRPNNWVNSEQVCLQWNKPWIITTPCEWQTYSQTLPVSDQNQHCPLNTAANTSDCSRCASLCLLRNQNLKGFQCRPVEWKGYNIVEWDGSTALHGTGNTNRFW